VPPTGELACANHGRAARQSFPYARGGRYMMRGAGRVGVDELDIPDSPDGARLSKRKLNVFGCDRCDAARIVCRYTDHGTAVVGDDGVRVQVAAREHEGDDPAVLGPPTVLAVGAPSGPKVLPATLSVQLPWRAGSTGTAPIWPIKLRTRPSARVGARRMSGSQLDAECGPAECVRPRPASMPAAFRRPRGVGRRRPQVPPSPTGAAPTAWRRRLFRERDCPPAGFPSGFSRRTSWSEN
jgi:hypothetical protein